VRKLIIIETIRFISLFLLINDKVLARITVKFNIFIALKRDKLDAKIT